MKLKYAVAEYFLSPQGEGQFAGTLMWFIRLAGCSVGKPMTTEEREHFAKLEGVATLPVYREKCTLYDGRTFACDTDFQTHEVLTAEQILEKIPEGVQRVCLTGGEPLDKALTQLLEALRDAGYLVHIETSGTVNLLEKAFPQYMYIDNMENESGWLWLTLSPKHKVLPTMISIANEIKLLVDENFDVNKLPPGVMTHKLIYLQAINPENTICWKNMELCLELQKKYPQFRVSGQWHKAWGVR